MKESLVTVLRDQKTSRDSFRNATEQLSLLLAGEASQFLKKIPKKVKTPIDWAQGTTFAQEIVVIPILRAGLAMLPAFLRFYPQAAVGFFGMRRDETTKKPHLYYENLPVIDPKQNVIIIDPMIATGGSAVLALKKLKSKGIPEENIICVGIIGAPEGISHVKEEAPKCHLIVAQLDGKLNKDAFIVPGLGDFGDRYFGTEGEISPQSEN